MKIRALTLDYYGTLVDWLPVWEAVSAKIVKKNKLKCTPAEFALSWRRAQRWFVEKMPELKYKQVVQKSLNEVCGTFGVQPSGEEQELFDSWKNIQPFPETVEVLKELGKQNKLVIVANSSRDLYDICAKKIPLSFDNLFISDETGVTKPHADMYELAVRFLGIPRSNILHVASSQMDLSGATAAGLPVCWINRRKEKKSPETPSPLVEISSLKELLAVESRLPDRFKSINKIQ